MKLVWYNKYLVSSVDTDGLVHYHHQSISKYNADYPAMHYFYATA